MAQAARLVDGEGGERTRLYGAAQAGAIVTVVALAHALCGWVTEAILTLAR